MPRARTPATRNTLSSRLAGSAELNAMVARVAPAILELLADGEPRSKVAVVEVLAGHHGQDDVALTLVRLAATGQLVGTGGKYTLAMAPEP